ncbi:RNA polymerase-binding protein DksA [Neptuniibacter sp. QD37_11]|uniref:RNA polymerase-binding protein DksA n=1 Tax=Neptuniibacter sp. QD37_11 TaxID=3398209 RepID=UPI0039F4766C
MTNKNNSNFSSFEPYVPAADEGYMSDEQIAHFKTILLNWKSELIESARASVENLQDNNEHLADPVDQASKAEELRTEMRTREREAQAIRKIDSALERIHDDEYGFCDNCGADIGLKRLEARPTASLCIECKTAEERRERLHA